MYIFLGFIGNIARCNDVYNEWNFTALQEGKWLADREGGCNEGASICITTSPNMRWDPNKSFAANLIDKLRIHFNCDRLKIMRCFYEMPTHLISTVSSPHKTLPCLTSIYCFLTLKKDHKYHRQCPCNCNECMNYTWCQCTQMDICGVFHQHNFIADVIYQLPVQPSVMSSKNDNNISMQPYNRYNRCVRDYHTFIRYKPYQ